MSLFESRLASEDADPFTMPDIVTAPGGRRDVTYTGDMIQTNLDWIRPRYPEMLRPDGLLQLDTAGEHLYRPVEDRRVRPGFTAYERI